MCKESERPFLAEGRRLGLAYERQLWRKQIPRKTK
jgi:hypothetical protein